MAKLYTAIFLLVLIAKLTEAHNKGSGSQHFLSSLAPKNVDVCGSVASKGYKCEEHKLTTEDGYILSMQRIPVSRSGQKATKPPVLLQHGIFSDASTFTSDLPTQSLAFVLAERGFDVWLSNARGTAPSRGHTKLTDNDARYWEWSWDELTAYDLPAFYNYIHGQTNQKIHFVGYSMGTLMGLGAFSQGKLTNLTRSASLLGPTVFLSQIPSPVIQAVADIFLKEERYYLNLREFVLQGDMRTKLVNQICFRPGMDCYNLLSAFTGSNCCINELYIDIYNEPTSTKNIIHFSQMVRGVGGSVVRKHDYGSPSANMLHYGQPSPPSYEMSAIPTDLPLYISYGKNDRLSDVKGVQTLLDKLKNHNKDKMVVQFVEKYAHLDFVRGTNANTVVYAPMISFMEKY